MVISPLYVEIRGYIPSVNVEIRGYIPSKCRDTWLYAICKWRDIRGYIPSLNVEIRGYIPSVNVERYVVIRIRIRIRMILFRKYKCKWCNKNELKYIM